MLTTAVLAGSPAAYAMSTAELMKATALDEVLTQFSAAIEQTPREQACRSMP